MCFNIMKKSLILIATFCCSIAMFAKNVSVSVSPENAIVYQKGKIVQPVSPGVYSIQVSITDLVFAVQADGYDAEQFVINLKSPSTMKINLKPNRKSVSITSNPSTADIYVDGRLMGQSPIDFTINKGESKSILLVADEYDRYVKTINFNDQHDIKMAYNIEMVRNTRSVEVYVDVPAATFLVDGVVVSDGQNRATIKLFKDRAIKLNVKAEGYIEYSRVLNFNDDVPANLTKDLSPDQGYAASDPINDQANKPFTITVRKGMSREDAIQRMKYFLSEAFETLEINDNISGWYRSAWSLRLFKFEGYIVRTRVEIKEKPDNGDGLLQFKILLQSQIAYKTDGARDEDYKNWTRVLKEYNTMLSDIKNQIE